MDRFKIILAVLKKYHFWVLSGIAVAAGLTVWSFATADLAKQIGTRKTTLDGAFANMEGVCAVFNHANQEVIDSIGLEEAAAAKEALAAWTILYQNQKQDNQLPTVLSPGFAAHFNALSGPEDTIPWQYLEEYRNFIRQHFPTLFDELGVRQPKKTSNTRSAGLGQNELNHDNGGRTGPGPPTPAPVDPEDPANRQAAAEGIVDWDEKDRKRIEDRFLFPRQPTTREVVLAQEDLWVYEALIRIIQNTNKPATDYDRATIKRIETLRIGEDVPAPGTFGATLRIEALDAASTKEARLGGASRYVDDQNIPLARSNRHPYYDHPNAEFKMMPIRVKLHIKQTKIPKLLVECANSKMPVEVRRVRLRPGEGTPVDLSQSVAGPGGTAEDASGASPSRPALHAAPLTKRTLGRQAGPLVIPVEIDGIICIYNPPDRKKLGTGAAPEETAAASAATSDATPAPPTGPGPSVTPGTPGATPETTGTAPAATGQTPGTGG